MRIKRYITEEMPADVWMPVKANQIPVIKLLMLDDFGWPVFSLNFNKEGNKVQKTII